MNENVPTLTPDYVIIQYPIEKWRDFVFLFECRPINQATRRILAAFQKQKLVFSLERILALGDIIYGSNALLVHNYIAAGNIF